MTGLDVLPCGCVVETKVVDDVPVFQMTPCRLDCKYFVYAMEEMRKSGKPIEYRRGP